MNCKVCGSIVDNADRVCAGCGSDLRTQQPEAAFDFASSVPAYHAAQVASHRPSLENEKDEAINRILYEGEGLTARERIEERRKRRQSGHTGIQSLFSQERRDAKAPLPPEPAAPVYQAPPEPAAPVYQEPPVRRAEPVYQPEPAAPVYQAPPEPAAPVYQEPPVRRAEPIYQPEPAAPVYQAPPEPAAPVYQESAPVSPAPVSGEKPLRSFSSEFVFGAKPAPVTPPAPIEPAPPVYQAPEAPSAPSAPAATPEAEPFFTLQQTDEEQAKFVVDKKNEEFQELLDREFERLKSREASAPELHSQLEPEVSAAQAYPPSTESTGSYIDDRIEEYLKKSELEMLHGGRSAAPAAVPMPDFAAVRTPEPAEGFSFDGRDYAHAFSHGEKPLSDFDANKIAYKSQEAESDPIAEMLRAGMPDQEFTETQVAPGKPLSYADFEIFEPAKDVVPTPEPAIEPAPAAAPAPVSAPVAEPAPPAPEAVAEAMPPVSVPAPVPPAMPRKADFPPNIGDILDAPAPVPPATPWKLPGSEAPTKESAQAFVDRPIVFPFDDEAAPVTAPKPTSFDFEPLLPPVQKSSLELNTSPGSLASEVPEVSPAEAPEAPETSAAPVSTPVAAPTPVVVVSTPVSAPAAPAAPSDDFSAPFAFGNYFAQPTEQPPLQAPTSAAPVCEAPASEAAIAEASEPETQTFDFVGILTGETGSDAPAPAEAAPAPKPEPVAEAEVGTEEPAFDDQNSPPFFFGVNASAADVATPAAPKPEVAEEQIVPEPSPLPEFLTFDTDELGKPSDTQASIPGTAKSAQTAVAKKSTKEGSSNAGRTALSVVLTILIIILVIVVACIATLKLAPTSLGAKYVMDAVQLLQSKLGIA